MAAVMTFWERVRAALRGDPVDRVPISLWRHFPRDDQSSDGLAAATLRWQARYHFDLVKFTPTGTYGAEDWGAVTHYVPNDHGVRTVVKFGVTDAEQWPRLQRLVVAEGCLGRQLEALRLAAEGLRGSVPLLMTVFSPLTTARKLGGERVFADLRCRPDLLAEGLEIITDTTARLAQESVRAGAHGVFFASQCASYRLLTEAEYVRFGEQYDRRVLDAVRAEGGIILLHAHGEDVMFDLLTRYPADALNWHDRTAGPSLQKARKRFPGMLVGGLDEWGALLKGPPEAIQREVRDAIAQTQGRGVMIGPGCVLSITTPAASVREVKRAVEAVV